MQAEARLESEDEVQDPKFMFLFLPFSHVQKNHRIPLNRLARTSQMHLDLIQPIQLQVVEEKHTTVQYSRYFCTTFTPPKKKIYIDNLACFLFI